MLGSWPRGPRALSAESQPVSRQAGWQAGWQAQALPTRGLQGDRMHIQVRGHPRVALRGTRG